MDQNLDNKSQRDQKEKISNFVSSVIYRFVQGKSYIRLINHSYIKSKVVLIDLNRHVRLNFDETRVGPRSDCRYSLYRIDENKPQVVTVHFKNQYKLLQEFFHSIWSPNPSLRVFFRYFQHAIGRSPSPWSPNKALIRLKYKSLNWLRRNLLLLSGWLS